MALLRSILYWNCNSLNSVKFAELEALTLDNKPLCIIAAETKHVNNSDVKQLAGYSAFGKPFLPRSGGIIVYLLDSLRGIKRRTDLELSPHVVAFEIALRTSPLLVLACYHHEASHSLPGILNSIKSAAGTGLPLLSIGDFNAQHAEWGSAHDNSAGLQLAGLCDDLDLTVLNAVHSLGQATFYRGNVSSILDLALTSHPSLFEDARPDSDIPLMSDHVPLHVSLRSGLSNARAPSRKYWSYSFPAANWDLFRDDSERYFSELLRRWQELLHGSPQQQVDAAYNEFLAVVLGCAELAVPLRLIQIGGKVRLPPSVLEKRNAWHRAQRVYQKHYSAATKADMLRRRTEWRGAFRTVKAEIHAKRCERLDNAGPSEFWRHWARAHPRDKAPLSNVLDRNGIPPDSPEQALNNLGEYFADQCQPLERKHPSAEEKHAEAAFDSEDASNSPCETDEPFTAAEVSDACDHVKTGSAMGPDGLHPMFLKQLGPWGRQFLCCVGNLTLQLGALPAVWKQANIVPVYKKDGARSDPKNYRGISLTAVPCKLFERLLDKRLRLKLEPMLSRWQAGFRSKFSTLDQLFRLRLAAARAVRGRSQLPVAFLDISRAFDKTWYPGLLLKLQRMGITGKCWAWIKAFLSDRRVRAVDCGQYSRWFRITAGVPQGAVLSPLLFLVFINDIVPSDSGCECALFADDVAIWPSRCGRRGEIQLQTALDSMARWAETWRLSFNVKKSAVLTFRAGRGEVDRDCFRVGAADLPFCDSYTYLGLVFAHDLKWRLHSEAIVRKVRGTALAICGMVKRAGAPGPLSVRKLVVSICAVQVSYGMPIFRPDAQTCADLDAWMAAPLRQSLRLPKRTPAVPVLTEFGLLSSEHLFGKAALGFCRRAVTLDPGHPTAEHWAANSRGAERSEAKRFETAVGASSLELNNQEVAFRLQEKQLREWWPEEDIKHELPVKLLKLQPGIACYLTLDDKEVASRRARLRFDRSGLRASLRQRRLVPTADCPDCKGVPDTAEHVLMSCPSFSGERHACETALGRCRCVLDLATAMGAVEDVTPHQRRTSLAATGRLLRAIDRIAARRRRA